MQIEDFLRQNIELVDTYNFDKLYKLYQSRFREEVTYKLTQILFECDIDPLPYMTSIPDFFYANGSGNKTSITIPGNIKTIGMDAFRDSDIESVKINDGVTFIDSNAFSRCPNLLEIDIPDSVTEMRTYAFSECSSLTKAKLSSNLLTIKPKMFFNCPNLKVVQISNGIETIMNSAFNCCNSLEKIEYTGTMAEWKWIRKSPGWNAMTGRLKVYCSDGVLSKLAAG